MEWNWSLRREEASIPIDEEVLHVLWLELPAEGPILNNEVWGVDSVISQTLEYSDNLASGLVFLHQPIISIINYYLK